SINLSSALERAGRTDEAADVYRDLLRRGPNAEAEFRLAALTGQNAPPTPPPRHVTSLFDDYAETFEQHLTKGLNYRAPHLLFDADVLVYLGDLSGVFGPAAAALRPGGLFAFTAEAHESSEGEGARDPGYVLRPSRRYAHSAAYLRQTAVRSGFEEASFQQAVLRNEGGKDMAGYVGVLQA